MKGLRKEMKVGEKQGEIIAFKRKNKEKGKGVIGNEKENIDKEKKRIIIERIGKDWYGKEK